MSYLIQARLARDPHIIDRVAACVALEGQKAPQDWAFAHQWNLSAQPGWVAAYASAVAGGDDEPGANESAITDQMILSAVQTLLGVIPDAPDEPEDEEEPE